MGFQAASAGIGGEIMANKKGFEIAPQNPGWIKKRVPASYNDENLMRIIMFYVINTPCEDLSSRSIPVSSYGWGGNVWKNGKLKRELFDIANLKAGDNFISVKKIDEMKRACIDAKMTKDFHKKRSEERIVIYKPSRYNEFLAICYHIRNSLAHGRLAMYPIGNSEDIMFALEDGVKVKYDNKFQVRARMILKKSTLLKWIEIIEKGRLDEEI